MSEKKKAWIGTLSQTRYRTEVVYADTEAEALEGFEKLAEEASDENCSEPDWLVEGKIETYKREGP